WYRRNRSRRNGDDTVDHGGVRSDCVHERNIRTVVPALRVDDCLRRAGLALRLVLARSDAFGVLARSRDRGARASRVDLTQAGDIQQVVRQAGGQLQGRDRVGAGSPGGYGRDIDWCVLREHPDSGEGPVCGNIAAGWSDVDSVVD